MQSLAVPSAHGNGCFLASATSNVLRHLMQAPQYSIRLTPCVSVQPRTIVFVLLHHGQFLRFVAAITTPPLGLAASQPGHGDEQLHALADGQRARVSSSSKRRSRYCRCSRRAGFRTTVRPRRGNGRSRLVRTASLHDLFCWLGVSLVRHCDSFRGRRSGSGSRHRSGGSRSPHSRAQSVESRQGVAQERRRHDDRRAPGRECLQWKPPYRS